LLQGFVSYLYQTENQIQISRGHHVVLHPTKITLTEVSGWYMKWR